MRDISTPQHTSHRLAMLTRVVLALVGACALVWLLDSATPLFLPVTLALVAGVVFAPVADVVDRAGAPRVAGALIVLLAFLSVVVALILLFYPIVSAFLQRLPFMWFELQSTFSGIRSTMESVEEAQRQVALSLNDSAAVDQTPEPVAVPGFGTLIAYLPSIAAQIMIFVGVLYFFLLTRTELYAFLEAHTQVFSRKVLCKAEADVSRYFLTITAINSCFGILVSLMLSMLGMENAVYWGIAAFLVNYILYLGPICFAIALLIAGVVQFDGAMSVVPAAIFLTMNMTEGQFVTPGLVGKRMSVNPLLVFLSLVLWMWLWGPLGAVVAIPVLVWLRQVNKAVHRVDPDPRPGPQTGRGAAGYGGAQRGVLS